MNESEKLQLVKKYAPILWQHEKEAFLPEDCKVVVEISDLYRNGKRESDENQPRELNDLGKISKSEQCYLKIRDLDMKQFSIPETYSSMPELGPNAVARLAREKYGYDYMTNGIPTDKPNLPKYYARVSEAKLNPEEGEPLQNITKNSIRAYLATIPLSNISSTSSLTTRGTCTRVTGTA